MTNNLHNIPFYVDQKEFLIPVSYDSQKKISEKIQKSLFENGKYYVESDISGDVFQIFVDYWINNQKISFNSDNLYELHLLSKEFGLNLGIEEKKEYKNDLALSILTKATQNNKNKEINENFIAENIVFYLQYYPNTLKEVPITSLYNIFNNENFNLNGHHDLAYKFITGFQNGTRNSNLFVLIQFLDINYLSSEAKNDYFLNHELYFDFQPRNLINYFFQIQKENYTIKQQNEILQQNQVMNEELQKQNEQLNQQLKELKNQISKKNDQLKEKEIHNKNQQNETGKSISIINDLKNENKLLKNQQKINLKQDQNQKYIITIQNEINNDNEDHSGIISFIPNSFFILMIILVLYFPIFLLLKKLPLFNLKFSIKGNDNGSFANGLNNFYGIGMPVNKSKASSIMLKEAFIRNYNAKQISAFMSYDDEKKDKLANDLIKYSRIKYTNPILTSNLLLFILQKKMSNF